MPEANTHAAGLRAQCGFGAFCKPGDFLDRGPRLRMRAQFFLFSFGVFTANAFLCFLSHNMLLIWEGGFLAPPYNLSIISFEKSSCYPRRPTTLSASDNYGLTPEHPHRPKSPLQS